MSKEVKEAQKTKTEVIRLDIDIMSTFIGDSKRSTYIVMTGIPEDLPKEYHNTIIKAAKSKFIDYINTNKFIELYELGKTVADSEPLFLSVDKLTAVSIVNAEIVKK